MNERKRNVKLGKPTKYEKWTVTLRFKPPKTYAELLDWLNALAMTDDTLDGFKVQV